MAVPLSETKQPTLKKMFKTCVVPLSETKQRKRKKKWKKALQAPRSQA